MKGSDENGYQVVVRGQERIQLVDPRFSEDEKCLVTMTSSLGDINDMNEPTEKVLLQSLKDLSVSILKLLPANTEQLIDLVNGVTDLGYLTHLCAGNIDFELEAKQSLLEMTHLKDRSLKLLALLKDIKEGLEVQIEIRGKLNQKIGQTQRQNILREQMRAIREELGDGESSVEEKLRKKIEQAGMPEEVLKIAEQELQRFAEIGTQSPESHVIRNYLELLTALPWSQKSPDREIDLDEARRVLDADHYGLEKVKKTHRSTVGTDEAKKECEGIHSFTGRTTWGWQNFFGSEHRSSAGAKVHSSQSGWSAR